MDSAWGEKARAVGGLRKGLQGSKAPAVTIKAEPLYQRALAIREKAIGPENPDTINSIRNYAELLRKLGDKAAAEKLEARAKTAGA